MGSIKNLGGKRKNMSNNIENAFSNYRSLGSDRASMYSMIGKSLIDSDLAIVALPRCGNTYLATALSMSFPDLKMTSHIHDFTLMNNAKDSLVILTITRSGKDIVRSWTNVVYESFLKYKDESLIEGKDLEKIITQVLSLRRYLSSMDSDKFLRLNKIVIRFDDMINDISSVIKTVGEAVGIKEGLKGLSSDMIIESVKSKNLKNMNNSEAIFSGNFPRDRSHRGVVEEILLNPKIKKVESDIDEYYSRLHLMS